MPLIVDFISYNLIDTLKYYMVILSNSVIMQIFNPFFIDFGSLDFTPLKDLNFFILPPPSTSQKIQEKKP